MITSSTTSYRLVGVSKVFPGVVAVDHVDFEVTQGEVHGVIGKNGAGKTVMMTLIAGVTKVSQGAIWIGDTQVNPESYAPWEARRLGVSLIPQEPLFASNQSVVDNLFIGSPIKNRLGLLDHKKMAQMTEEIAGRLGIQAHPNQRIGALRIEDQQLLAFGKALFIDQAKVILLDEITASLPAERKKVLLQFLRNSLDSDPSLSFTLISHHINEILEFCHRVTVMRDGKAIKTLKISDTNKAELANLIVGEETSLLVNNGSSAHDQIATGSKTASSGVVLHLHSLKKQNSYEDVNLDLSKGEVVGLAGLDGSGKNELLETLGGLIKPDEGSIVIHGKARKIETPNKALENGISYLPKKREEQAVIHNRPVDENILLPIYPTLKNWLGLINRDKCHQIASEKVKSLNVKTPSLKTNIDYLSGGNRQKVILNRVSTTCPDIYVLNEPTRGVDLATKPEILRIIRQQFAQTSGVIVTSESEEELIDVCDRILIFYKGKIRRELLRDQPEFTVAEVYKSIQGVGLP